MTLQNIETHTVHCDKAVILPFTREKHVLSGGHDNNNQGSFCVQLWGVKQQFFSKLQVCVIFYWSHECKEND